jgi:hypothetical protein
MSLIPAGEYAAKPVDAGGGAAQSGTKFVRVKFQITEGPLAGMHIQQDFYLTERTWEGTTKTLATLGWNKVIADLKTTCIKPCSIVVEHEQEQDKNKNPRVDEQGKPVMRARVRWVNAAAPQFSASEADELAKLLSEWGCKDVRARTQGAPPPTERVERAAQSTADAPSSDAPSDDDIPF